MAILTRNVSAIILEVLRREAGFSMVWKECGELQKKNLSVAGGMFTNEFIEQNYLVWREGAKLNTALTFIHDTEGNLVFHFEIIDILNRDISHEEIAVD